MASEYFVVYNQSDGHILWRGQGNVGIAAAQTVEPGLRAVSVPQEFLTSTGYDYDALRNHLYAMVDQAAENCRAKFITPGSGQGLEYAEAYDQAVEYLADPDGDYPMLAADVSAGTLDPRTNEPVADISQAASVVMFMRAQWRTVGADIREQRLRAKCLIRAADVDIAAMVNIVDGIVWPSVD